MHSDAKQAGRQWRNDEHFDALHSSTVHRPTALKHGTLGMPALSQMVTAIMYGAHVVKRIIWNMDIVNVNFLMHVQDSRCLRKLLIVFLQQSIPSISDAHQSMS